MPESLLPQESQESAPNIEGEEPTAEGLFLSRFDRIDITDPLLEEIRVEGGKVQTLVAELKSAVESILDAGREDTVGELVATEIEKGPEYVRGRLSELDVRTNDLAERLKKLKSDVRAKTEIFSWTQNKTTDLASLREGLRFAVPLIQSTVAASTEFRSVCNARDDLYDAYALARIQHYGGTSIDDSYGLYEQKSTERRRLSGPLGIKRLFYRKELTQLDEEMAELSGFMSGRRKSSSNFSYFDREDAKNAFVDYAQSIEHKVQKKITECVEANAKERLRSEKATILDAAEVDALDNVLLEKFAVPELKGCSEEVIEDTVGLLKRSFEIKLDAEHTGSGPYSRLDSEIANLQGQSYRIAREFRGSGQRFQKVAAFVDTGHLRLKSGEEIQRIGLAAEASFADIFKMLGKVGAGLSGYSRPRLFGGDFDTLRFKAIAACPETKARFGEKIESARRTLEAGLERSLTSSAKNHEEGVLLASKLMDIGGPESVAVMLVNAFREPGYSGERLLLQPDKPESGPLVAYLSRLTDKDLEVLKGQSIPGLIECISLIRSHPADFVHPRPGSVYAEVQAELAKVVGHFFETRGKELFEFLVDSADNVDSDLGGSYAKIDDVLRKSDNLSFFSDVITTFRRRFVLFNDVKSLKLLSEIPDCLDNIDEFPQRLRGGIQKQLASEMYESYRSYESRRYGLAILQKGPAEEDGAGSRDASHAQVQAMFKKISENTILSPDVISKFNGLRLKAALGEPMQVDRDRLAELFNDPHIDTVKTDVRSFIFDLVSSGKVELTAAQAAASVDRLIEEAHSSLLLYDTKKSRDFARTLSEKSLISESQYRTFQKAIDTADSGYVQALGTHKGDLEITGANWVENLSWYIRINAGFAANGAGSNVLRRTFSNDHPANRDACLRGLYGSWRALLESGRLDMDGSTISRVVRMNRGGGWSQICRTACADDVVCR